MQTDPRPDQAEKGLRQGLKLVFDVRAVKSAFVIAAVSALALAVWATRDQQDLCAHFRSFVDYVGNHRAEAFAILMVWSFVLFLTIMPLGTTTILVAGYLLGPWAGVAQAVSLYLSSVLLYELSRDPRANHRIEQLKSYPFLARLHLMTQQRALVFVGLSRIVPVVPSAAASLAASYFYIGRGAFYPGTLATGWIRPVVFGLIGAFAQTVPVCG